MDCGPAGGTEEREAASVKRQRGRDPPTRRPRSPGEKLERVVSHWTLRRTGRTVRSASAQATYMYLNARCVVLLHKSIGVASLTMTQLALTCTVYSCPQCWVNSNAPGPSPSEE